MKKIIFILVFVAMCIGAGIWTGYIPGKTVVTSFSTKPQVHVFDGRKQRPTNKQTGNVEFTFDFNK